MSEAYLMFDGMGFQTAMGETGSVLRADLTIADLVPLQSCTCSFCSLCGLSRGSSSKMDGVSLNW